MKTRQFYLLLFFFPALWMGLAVSSVVSRQGTAQPIGQGAKEIPPQPPLEQYDEPKAAKFLAKASEFVRVAAAREEFNVSGDGLAVAVVDTGLRVTHKDFKDRVSTQINFTTQNGDKSDDARDLDGHGTHVAGIVAASGDHTGM